MPLSRQCPFNGCEQMIEPEMFACKPHWFSLTLSQRGRIYHYYRLLNEGKIDGQELRRRQQQVLDETKVGGHA